MESYEDMNKFVEKAYPAIKKTPKITKDVTAEDMLKTMKVYFTFDGKVGVSPYGRKVTKAEREYVMSAMKNGGKQEVIAIAEAGVRKEREAYKKKMAPVSEGLKKLREVKNAWSDYRDNFRRMMENEYNDGARPPKEPDVTIAEVAAKYPRAAAYDSLDKTWLEAYLWDIARAARERLLAMDDVEKVMSDYNTEAEKLKKAEVERHLMWD